MSCIWEERPGAEWLPLALAGGVALPLRDGVAVVAIGQGAALLVRPAVRVRVNGEAVLGGLRLLDHKDEILIGSTRLIFSAEATPLVAAHRVGEGKRAPICGVCRGPVRDGALAVACPGCGRWFHQEGAKACWAYAPNCRFCNHPTSFDADAAWRPEREESRV